MPKSARKPNAEPIASLHVIVHETRSLMRTYVVDALTTLAHANTDLVVGDETRNENGLPPETSVKELLIFSVIKKVVTRELGVVKTNEKAVPPPMEVKSGLPIPPVVKVGTEKSTERPRVGRPAASATVTVHDTASPTWTNVVDCVNWPTHDKADATPGVPATAKEKGSPPEIKTLDRANFSVTKNVVAKADGAVKKKLKLVPPPSDASVGVPVAPRPVEYVGTVKSVESATDTPAPSRTVIVQEISSERRT